ncbi:Protein CASEIN KINASE I-LIKE 4 [Portunus trituberculatus]|uniref:Protein CASEIN KINASE I-LIKE 4 n=1 Tax=Portunus trituberculatus TaxID=210409 RepID=A0A5B7J8M7_PORTR|nr:Protein CASEIN KINASE I-LIKE 4 [Portunus trituberculatus]
MEQWFDGMLLWTGVWSLLWVYCWVTWWRSTAPRAVLHTSFSYSPTRHDSTSSPITVTLEMLKRVARETTSTANDEQTWIWLRRVEAIGLQAVEARLVHRQFKLSNLLGEGTYGKVFQIQLADVNYPICIKVAKGIRCHEYNLKECEMLACLGDVKGVPRVVGVSLQPDAFIMTMHGNCTLAKCIRLRTRMPSEKLLLRVLQDLSGVLAKIHQRGLCHNDIKLNNVMVEPGNKTSFTVTLIDFGLMSRYGCYPFRIARKGKIKPFYDPELMRHEKTCSEATDMYSMGYLMRVILFSFPTTARHIQRLATLAMGPDSQRPSFLQLEDAFSNLAK